MAESDSTATERPEGAKVVYQVVNLDREEMFFGITDIELAKQMGEIAKLRDGPAAGWQRGELVQWRPLTDWLPEDQALAMARDLEKKKPPNRFTVHPFAERSAKK